MYLKTERIEPLETEDSGKWTKTDLGCFLNGIYGVGGRRILNLGILTEPLDHH